MRYEWLWINSNDLVTCELRQIKDEGKEVSPELESRIRELAARGDDYLVTPQGQIEAGDVLDETIALPMRSDYQFVEPSDLPGIHAERPAPVSLPSYDLSPNALQEKIYGAWLGRVYGCYLGKPVECLRRLPGESFIMETFLKQTGQWPLQGYFSLDYPADLLDSCRLSKTWGAGPDHLPPDDDTGYTVVGLGLMEKKGFDFTPDDVADYWMKNIPVLDVCTAERVAYRNFCINIDPPAAAVYHNPYREWIGAQIRADFFGYVAPGQPEKAAEYAWRDASISHVKNGIYGEMWVAAMLAAAFVTSDIDTVIRAGLAQVPAKSRFTQAINDVFSWRDQGLSYEAAVKEFDKSWNDVDAYDWCHTISNAQLCTIAMLWSDGDYTTAITRAVLPGFDTDCNGATVGSVMGAILGASALPQTLVSRVNDRFQTRVAGFIDCSIKETADRMYAQAIKNVERKE